MAEADPHKLSPEALAKREQRRAARHAREAKRLQVNRARPAMNTLNTLRSLAVVAASPDAAFYILGGMQARMPVLEVDAAGSIQNADCGFEYGEEILRQISIMRRTHGRDAAIAFTNYDYADTTSFGTDIVIDRIRTMIEQKNKHDISQDKDPSILLMGLGKDSSVLPPFERGYTDTHKRSIAELVMPRMILTADFELFSSEAPEMNPLRPKPRSALQADPVLPNPEPAQADCGIRLGY
jgi:hypothetical protein